MSFAYLQLYSRFAPFGGVSELENLAEQLLALTAEENQPLAAALTDTFSLAAYPRWRQLVSGSQITALAGAEVGLNLTGASKSLPYGLLLLAESQQGYVNLCRLLSLGLQQTGDAPLSAALDLATLQQYHQGLIAISPYFGGPVTAALGERKTGDARARAQTLYELFGPQNFFLGVPPLAAQTQPQTIEGSGGDRIVKLNAGLVKLGRELKIGLVGTGEARYARSEEARAYSALRHRLVWALGEQYPRSMLHSKGATQEWLFSLQPDRPLNDLHLRSTAELRAHYNESDWPGALSNNAQIATRCAAWQSTPKDYLDELRQRCETRLAERFPDDPRARQTLENELDDIADLGLALPLLAAAELLNKAESGQVIIARRLGGSLVANLLDLSRQLYEASEESAVKFEAYTGRRPLRLEVGQQGRARLLAGLNSEGTLRAAPLAIASESGAIPELHPRQVLFSLDGPLDEKVVLQPAKTERGLEIGAQIGPLAPEGCARLEIYESTGVGRLQLALDLLNRTRPEPLTAASLPVPAAAEYDTQTAGAFDRALVARQLEELKLQHPAAYYAASMTLVASDRVRLAGLAETVRQAGLSLLPPDINRSQLEFSLDSQNPAAIRVGLSPLLDPASARQVLEARQAGDFTGLDDFVKRVVLNAAEIERLSWASALDSFGERERLAASATQIEAAGRAWQTWRDQNQARAASQPATEKTEEATSGQLSLFDLIESVAEIPEALILDEPAGLVLAEAEPVSRLERLRRSFQALGFFTSEHPLWNQLPASSTEIARDEPISLGEMAKLESETRPVVIAGLLIGLRRLPIAGSGEESQGEELTVLQLEDFSGRAEVLLPRGTPAEEVELAEGAVLTARVRRLKPPEGSADRERLVLVALALAPYPPKPGQLLSPASEDTPDLTLAADLEATSPERPSSNAPAGAGTPPNDQGWAESLFASLGVPAEKPKAPASAANGGKNNAKAPVRLVRRVHIRLPRTESEEANLDLLEKLNGLLRQFPGEDSLILYLPQPDGSTIRLEPQSLNVSYSDMLVHELTGLVGPGMVDLEERTV